MCMTCVIEEVTGFDLSTDEGHDALAELGRILWPDASDQMLEAAGYIGALYGAPSGGTGGPLHVVTDDFNVEDDNLVFCRKYIADWEPYGDGEDEERVRLLSAWILDLLEPMSEVERSVAIALGHNELAELHGKIYMPSREFAIRENILDEGGNVIGTQWGFRHRRVDPS